MRRLLAPLIAAAVLAPASASAQSSRPFVEQTAALNPIALPLGLLSGEYERALGRSGAAVGVGGYATFASSDLYSSDERRSSLQAKLKYFPAQNGLRGFSVGVTAGVVRSSQLNYRYPAYDFVSPPQVITPTVTRLAATRPTLGAVLDYNVMLGPRRRFLLGFGVGARRVLGSEAQRRNLDQVIPDGRLQVGFGF